MKITILKSILSLLLSILPAALSAQGYAWHQVTPDEAAQSIRQFEANPNLNFRMTPALTEDSGRKGEWKPIPHSAGIPSRNDLLCCYSLNSDHYQYSINYYTHDEFSRIDTSFFDADKFYGQPYDPAVLKPLAMSENAAQAIAQAFMVSHYPEPFLLNKLSINPDFGRQGNVKETLRFVHSYDFNFYQDCGNGVTAPANCFIEVDTIKGQVIIFAYTHYPVLISPFPQITGEEAMAIAMNSLQISDGVPNKVEATGISKPDSMGQETLYYAVTFNGRRTDQSVYQTYYVVVDANTGEITHWDIANGIVKAPKTPVPVAFTILRAKIARKVASSEKPLSLITKAGQANLNYPLLAIHSKAYVYTNYLCEGVPDAKIIIDAGKQISITSKSRQVSLCLNSQTYQINGQTKQMSAKPVLVNGRCYVPLDVMQAVLGGKWTYDAKAQTVHYEPPQVKQASK